jgi:molybdopterin/thiamine biosynthesis adenylyltransferase
MSNLELRIPLGVGEAVMEAVFRRGRHEYVAIGLISAAKLPGRELLLLRRLYDLPEEAYRETLGHGATWRGAAMVPALQAAVDEGLGIVLLHAHVHDGPPRLSGDDRTSADRLLPMFSARVPARPHGSIVLSRTHASGLIAMPRAPTREAEIDVRWLGASILDWRSRALPSSIRDPMSFARQMLIVRDDGQRTLADARVAIVGLGGGGSHVAQQLAHLGVGKLILVDPGRASRTDRHRLVALTRLDVWLRRRKPRVIRRAVRRIAMGARCQMVTERVPAPEAVAALRQADVIVGCVDNLHARADLQEFAWRFVIPYVDVGVNIRAIEKPELDGPRVTIGGNVITLIPGGFCLWCCGFLSKEKLAAELRGPDRSYFENREGEAQVVSLNGLVASQAVTEVLQLLTGFGGSGLHCGQIMLDDQPGIQRGFRKLDGVRGTLEDWGASRRSDCAFCSATLAAGTIAWTHPDGDPGPPKNT